METTIVYTVNVGYRTFTFDNRIEALNFAELALRHMDEETYVEIRLTILKPEETPVESEEVNE